MAKKIELKKIARLHAAGILLATESLWAFDGTELTGDDFDYLDDEFKRIAFRLLKNDKPLFDSKEIVDSVCGG